MKDLKKVETKTDILAQPYATSLEGGIPFVSPEELTYGDRHDVLRLLRLPSGAKNTVYFQVETSRIAGVHTHVRPVTYTLQKATAVLNEVIDKKRLRAASSGEGRITTLYYLEEALDKGEQIAGMLG